MRYKSSLVAALAVVAAGSCVSDGMTGFVSTELDGYCAVAAQPGLVSWVGDVVTFCEQGELDHHGRCSAGRVVEGQVEPIELADDLAIQLALPASGGRLVLLLEDHRLILADGQGVLQRELDRWAADPSISADGERLAWIGIPDGLDAAEAGMGTPKVVAVRSLSDSERTVLVEDPMASAPRPIPGTLEVLYVSAGESGVAGFFIAGPSRGATQITNLGLVEDDELFDPVAGAPAIWGPDGSLFFGVTGLESAEEPMDELEAEPDPSEDVDVEEVEDGVLVDDGDLDVSHVFRLAIVDDEARIEELGEGGWPQLSTDGGILAALPSGSSPCATTYTLEGTP